MEYNYQTASFSEMISVTSLKINLSNFDIVLDDTDDLESYCEALIQKVFELPHTEYPAFIIYQTNLFKEPILWLNHFEELISNNEDLFTGKRSLCRYNKLFNLIESKRKELQSSSVKESKLNTPKRFINADSEDRHFSFQEVKERIGKMESFGEKIMYLTEEVFEYKQADIISINNKLQTYDSQCNQLIEKLQTIRKMKIELENEQKSLNAMQSQHNKMRFNGNLNQLVDIFYQLNRELFVDGKSYIDGNTNDLVAIIVNSFLDKEGKEISPLTVKTILKPSKEEKRPNTHKRIDIDKLL